MNVLYVGPFNIPLIDILTGKKDDEITGFPGYFYPFRLLIEEGIRVDFVGFSNLREYDIRVDWFHEDQIVGNICDNLKYSKINSRFIKKAYSFVRLIRFFFAVEKSVRKKKYDFIYCQDYLGIAGVVSANIHHIPCGVRFYGDTFILKSRVLTKYEYIMKHGKLKLLLKKPLIYLLYKLKKDFVLTTADGTHGDLTYKMLSPKRSKCQFFFWTTGVKKTIPDEDPNFLKVLSGIKFIVYPARIDSIKRQDRAVEVLHLLHQRGYPLHLFLIGQNCDNAFFQKLRKKIKEADLDEFVHFTGGIPQKDMIQYALHSVCCILTSDCSNRGNVFFEVFSVGVPVVTFNDGSLNEYVQDNYNGFLDANEQEIADSIVKLLCDEVVRRQISENALLTADQKVLSLEKRFKNEVDLILKCAKHENLSDLPHII